MSFCCCAPPSQQSGFGLYTANAPGSCCCHYPSTSTFPSVDSGVLYRDPHATNSLSFAYAPSSLSMVASMDGAAMAGRRVVVLPPPPNQTATSAASRSAVPSQAATALLNHSANLTGAGATCVLYADGVGLTKRAERLREKLKKVKHQQARPPRTDGYTNGEASNTLQETAAGRYVEQVSYPHQSQQQQQQLHQSSVLLSAGNEVCTCNVGGCTNNVMNGFSSPGLFAAASSTAVNQQIVREVMDSLGYGTATGLPTATGAGAAHHRHLHHYTPSPATSSSAFSHPNYHIHGSTTGYQPEVYAAPAPPPPPPTFAASSAPNTHYQRVGVDAVNESESSGDDEMGDSGLIARIQEVLGSSKTKKGSRDRSRGEESDANNFSYSSSTSSPLDEPNVLRRLLKLLKSKKGVLTAEERRTVFGAAAGSAAAAATAPSTAVDRSTNDHHQNNSTIAIAPPHSTSIPRHVSNTTTSATTTSKSRGTSSSTRARYYNIIKASEGNSGVVMPTTSSVMDRIAKLVNAAAERESAAAEGKDVEDDEDHCDAAGGNGSTSNTYGKRLIREDISYMGAGDGISGVGGGRKRASSALLRGKAAGHTHRQNIRESDFVGAIPLSRLVVKHNSSNVRAQSAAARANNHYNPLLLGTCVLGSRALAGVKGESSLAPGSCAVDRLYPSSAAAAIDFRSGISAIVAGGGSIGHIKGKRFVAGGGAANAASSRDPLHIGAEVAGVHVHVRGGQATKGGNGKGLLHLRSTVNPTFLSTLSPNEAVQSGGVLHSGKRRYNNYQGLASRREGSNSGRPFRSGGRALSADAPKDNIRNIHDVNGIEVQRALRPSGVRTASSVAAR